MHGIFKALADGQFNCGPENKQCCPENKECYPENKECGPENKECSKPGIVFIKDVTIPDGAQVAPSEKITKTWQLVNKGETDFPEGSKLIFLRGDREMSVAEEFPVPLARSGETVDVSALIVTPPTPGRYTAYYQLADKDRNRFGPRLWVDLTVGEQKQGEGKETKAAIPTPAISATPKIAPAASPAASTASPKPVSAQVATPPPISLAAAPDAKKSEEEKLKEKYSEHLNALGKMGFDKVPLNLYLLQTHQGKLQNVVEALLSTRSQ